MILKHLLYALCSVAAFSSPAVAAGTTLDTINCEPLKLNFVQMMPEIIRPGQFIEPNPPFTKENLDQLANAAQLDPNGLCQYRDANRALDPATQSRVVFFGDSITEYWSIGDPALFQEDVIDRGISAQNTSQMLLRFQHDVVALNPQIVHILAGINDAMAPNGTLSTRQNIVSMVELARAHNIEVILGSLTPSDSFWLAPNVKLAAFVTEHNAWLQEYARRENLTYIDYFHMLAGPDGKMKPSYSNDGLHPNRLGYSRMGPLIRQALQMAREPIKSRDKN